MALVRHRIRTRFVGVCYIVIMLTDNRIALSGVQLGYACYGDEHGLPVFCAGIFLSFVGRVALEQSEGWPMQAAVNLAGLLAMVAIAAWNNRPTRASRCSSACVGD